MTNWFITGISRGLGRALATAALARGDTVVGTARSGSFSLDHELGTLHVLAADLGVQGSAEASVTKAFELVGAVDVIVNSAGFGLLGAVENATDQEVQALFAVDFFAPLRIIQTALPHLRKQGSGHIINITSIAGRAPTTGTAIYAAAKSALEALSMGLALEVAPLGIKVTAVAPGAFRTEFLSPNSVLRSAAADAVYSETIGRRAAAFETADGHQVGDPELAAKAIIALADSANAPLHLLLGSDALTRARAKLGRVIEEMDAWEPVTRSTDFRDEPGTSDNAGGENEEARSPLVSNFIEAARSVFSSARMDDPTGSVLGDVFKTISSGRRPISRAVREIFPVCALVEPLLDELERTDERLRNVAKALRPLLPHIGWKRRQTGKNASDNFSWTGTRPA